MLNQLKTGVKIAIVAILIPTLIKSAKKIFRDSKARKSLFFRFLRTTLYIAVFGSFPAFLFCMSSNIGIPVTRLSIVIEYAIGGLIAFLIEPVARH